MSKADTIDATKTDVTPSVFPTDEDMAVWQKLTPAQQRDAIMRKVEKGLAGSAANKATKDEIMAELRAERGA
jgi:hypothetical protein